MLGISTSALALCCFLFVSRTSAEKLDNDWTGYKVYRLQVTTHKQLDFLTQMDNVIDSTEGMSDEVAIWTHLTEATLEMKLPVTVMISPNRQKEVLAAFDQEGLIYTVSIPDLAAALAEESYVPPADTDTRAIENGGMTWTAYHRYATIESWAQNLAAKYPEIVTLKVIGKSYEGRNLYLLKIGKARSDGKTKTAVWMDSHIHAREWIASATLTYMANKLVVEYARNASIAQMVEDLDWYILPVVNPDGVEHTHSASGARMWRRTRKVNPFAECLGADPNRNYDHKWMLAGATQSACSDINGGPYPFSEVENIFLTDAALEVKQQLKVFLTIHSAAEMMLTPWGYALEYPPDIADLTALGQRMANAIYAQYKVRYRVGSSTALLGAAAGATDDWAKAKAGVKYAYTVELRDRGYSFILPPSQIIESGIETFEAMVEVHRTVKNEFGTTI